MTNTTTVRALKIAVMTGEALALGWLLATEDLRPVATVAVSAAGIASIVAVGISNWPLGAVSILTAASAMPRLRMTLFGLHVRPEHVAIGFTLTAIVVQVFRQQIRPKLELRRFDLYLLAYIAANFLSSALTSPDRRMTLRWAALNALVITPYFLFRMLLKSEPAIRTAMRVLLCVGVAESACGIISFLSNRLFDTQFGVESQQYGFIPGVHGTQYEANLFGSYCASAALMCLTLWLLSHPRRALYAWGFGLGLIGALISLARSVYLAIPVAIVFVLWAAFKTGRAEFRILVRLAAGIAILLVALSPLIYNFVVERFSTLDVTELSDDTTLNRLVQTMVALDDVRAHPIMGMGTSSFQLVFDWADYGLEGMKANSDEGGWISNTPLRIAHDTGAIGLTISLLFLGSLTRACYRAIKVGNDEQRTGILALAAGLLLYAITFQATEATLLSFTWVHVGLFAAFIVTVENQHSARPAENAMPSDFAP